MADKGLSKRLRTGYIVFGALVGIKVLEYLIVTLVHQGGWPYMAILAFAGAWLIFYYFMHVYQLWRRSKHGE